MKKLTSGYFWAMPCFCIIMASCGVISANESAPALEVVAKVLDENGKPLPHSIVTASFRHTNSQKKQLGTWNKKFESIYDGENEVRFSYKADRTVAIEAIKEGYWSSGFRHNFLQSDRISGGNEENGPFRREFAVILRKKENPRPLFVNRIDRFEVPDLNKAYGFDLEVGDWVAPNGKGVSADFIFKIKRKSGDEHPAYWSEITWSFSQPDDGFIEVKKSNAPYSKLHLGRVAPLEGYINEYSRVVGIKKVKGVFVKDSHPPLSEIDLIEGCWFRVRSQSDDHGEVTGRYGKIIGTVQYSTRGEKNPHISFTYYFSPDTSRSLEWNGDSLIPGANLQSVKMN